MYNHSIWKGSILSIQLLLSLIACIHFSGTLLVSTKTDKLEGAGEGRERLRAWCSHIR